MMDNSLISLLIAWKSSMNFHNLKVPVQGKSRVFKQLHSSRKGVKEYVYRYT